MTKWKSGEMWAAMRAAYDATDSAKARTPEAAEAHAIWTERSAKEAEDAQAARRKAKK